MNGRKTISNLLGTLKHEIEEVFTRDIPPSESRHGRLIQYAKKEYRDKNIVNESAAIMLASFQGTPLPNNKHDLIPYFLLAVLVALELE